MIKARGLREIKTRVRVRVRRKSLPQKLRMLTRIRKLQQRRRKWRPRPKKMILRPRMLLPPSRARRNILSLPGPRLST